MLVDALELTWGRVLGGGVDETLWVSPPWFCDPSCLKLIQVGCGGSPLFLSTEEAEAGLSRTSGQPEPEWDPAFLISIYLFLFHMYECLPVCRMVHHVRAWYSESEGGYLVLWNWSHRWLWANMWVSSSLLITDEPSLQPEILSKTTNKNRCGGTGL